MIAIEQWIQQIRTDLTGRAITQIMEVCGTHTVSLFRTGVKSMLPPNLRLISGPGCPVCVTSQAYLDAACDLAARPDVTICTYGDMVRVPGRSGSLADMRGRGAAVRVVFSARDALTFARQNPDRQVVFLSVGFETTAPASAAALREAAARDVPNLSFLLGHKLVVPAMTTLLSAGEVPIDGFLCPGHVSIVLGADAFTPVARDFHKPCVVAGFEARNMLAGIAGICRQLAQGRSDVENVYPVAVTAEGNTTARDLLWEVFEPADAVWRAIGTIPQSGLALREPYRRFDTAERFAITFGPDYEPPGCQCGQVIQGKASPADCPLFGGECTPTQPVGPCMVSSEGACAAWYKYGKREQVTR